MSDVRRAHCVRTTKETDIDLTFTIDGSGKSMISTDIGFFDHMLEGFARHGLFDLDVKIKGDLIVDCHHTIEDCGIVLGAYSAGLNLHIQVLKSGNNHHMAEAMFKAFAKALDAATTKDPRIADILSTKGSLA